MLMHTRFYTLARAGGSLGLYLAAAIGLGLPGCASGDADPGPADMAGPVTDPTPYQPPAASAVIEQQPLPIRREVFLVDAPAPDKNPEATSHAETPAALNRVRVVRYRVDTGSAPPRPARAIAVLMPGFLGGAGSYDPMARALVRRSTPDAAFEAWAIDRRANLLEDQHGLDVAEVRRDPELARRYYFAGAELEGQRYAGVRAQEDLAFMSEWGLASTLQDLRAVIGLVPPAERRDRIVLVGHSLGASIVEEYAAWDWDGAPGFDELAGLVLVDGTSAVEGKAAPDLTAQQYLDGFGTGSFVRAGLKQIRRADRYFLLPLLGPEVYSVAAISALRAAQRPQEIVEDDRDREGALRILLGLTRLPRMTNRAALGFSFDRAYNGLSFAAVSCGASTGGATEPYTSVLGETLLHPSDPAATYGWSDFDRTAPTENTSLDELARSWYEGPGLDFGEWYFPSRLSLDAPAAGTLVLKETDWPRAMYGLRAVHGQKMDLPILALSASLVGRGNGDTSAYDALRDLVRATPVGSKHPGRPKAGATRDTPDGFEVVAHPGMTHIDPLMAADHPSVGTGRLWYDKLRDFALKNTPSGGVVIAPKTPIDSAR